MAIARFWSHYENTSGRVPARPFQTATQGGWWVDIMTHELVTVPPDMPISEVAQTMREQHVHRVLVTENRELLGVLTTFDLLRAFEPVGVARTLLHRHA